MHWKEHCPENILQVSIPRNVLTFLATSWSILQSLKQPPSSPATYAIIHYKSWSSFKTNPNFYTSLTQHYPSVWHKSTLIHATLAKLTNAFGVKATAKKCGVSRGGWMLAELIISIWQSLPSWVEGRDCKQYWCKIISTSIERKTKQVCINAFFQLTTPGIEGPPDACNLSDIFCWSL